METASKYLVVLGVCVTMVVTIAFATDAPAKPAQDKYSLKVPGGLAFSEFRGYEGWETISISQKGALFA